MGLRILSVSLVLFVTLLGPRAVMANAGPTRALEPLAERIFQSFNTPRRRYVVETFLATREGRALARSAEISTVEDLAERLALEHASAFGGELEAQLRKIDGAMDDFRRLRAEAGNPINGQALTKQERFLVRFLVGRHLRLSDPEAILRQILPRRYRFFQSSSSSELSSARKAFRDLEPVDPVPTGSSPLSRPTASVPPVSATVDAAARRDVEGWFSKIKGCVKARASGTHTEAVGRETDRAYLWQGLFVNSSLAGVGYVTSVGVKNVDISDLSTDLAMSIASTTVGAKIMAGRMNLKTRWMRILMFGGGRTVVDGTLYALDPVDRLSGGLDHAAGHSMDETLSRGSYNAGYNVLSSPKSIGTYLLFNGIMDCFPSNRWVQLGVGGLRALENVGSTFLFFHARQHFTQPEE